MLLQRKLILAGTLSACLGSLLAAVGYGLYLRSPAGRDWLAGRMASRLGLHVDLARAAPADFGAWTLGGFSGRLAGPSRWMLSAPRGWWDERGGVARLDLEGAVLSLQDSRSVRLGDLGDSVRGLQVSQAPGGCRVLLADLKVNWAAEGGHQILSDANAVVVLNSHEGTWQASLDGACLNGHRLQSVGRLVAAHAQGGASRAPQARLQLARIPIEWLNYPGPCGQHISRGFLEGTCHQLGGSAWQWQGVLSDLELEEWSCVLAPQARLQGRVVEVTVQASGPNKDLPETIRCRAVLTDVQGSDLAALLGLPDLGGCVQLEIARAQLACGRVLDLQVSGTWADLDLLPLVEFLGCGQATGRLDVAVHELHGTASSIDRADLEVHVRTTAEEPALIHAGLLRTLGKNWLGLDVPPLPDAELEIERAAFRVSIDGPHLRLHSVSPDAMLTVRLLGREVVVFRIPPEGIVLDDCWRAASPSPVESRPFALLGMVSPDEP